MTLTSGEEIETDVDGDDADNQRKDSFPIENFFQVVNIQDVFTFD